VKGEAQHAREMPPHGSLSRTHGADEEDVSLVEHVSILYGLTRPSRKFGENLAPHDEKTAEGGFRQPLQRVEYQ